MKKFSRHSVIYQHDSKSFSFYDKVRDLEKDIRETKKKMDDNPENDLTDRLKIQENDLNKIKDINLLRLEYREKKSPKGLNGERLIVKDLRDEKTYKDYPKKFKEVFYSFHFKKDLVYEGITKPTDFRNFLILKGLESMGWYESSRPMSQDVRVVYYPVKKPLGRISILSPENIQYFTRYSQLAGEYI